MTATNTGLPNTPDSGQIGALIVLCQNLEKIRLVLKKPIIVNSAFRSADVNIAVGGAKNSAHKTGYAADIVVRGMNNKQICEEIIKSGIKFDQLIDENKNGSQWIHISFDPAMRGQYLVYSNGQYKVHE